MNELIKQLSKSLRKYQAFFRLRFSMGLQYRAAAVAGMITQFFWGAMNILVYRAFYQTDPAAFPMTLSATCSYIWFQQAFLMLFAAWHVEGDIFDHIVNGSVAYEMCRPVRIYNMWFARTAAVRLSGAALRCLPVLLFAACLPAPYGLAAPASLPHLGLFLGSLVIGYLVTVSFFMLLYGLTFFTVSPRGLRMLITSMVEFLAGAVIPLPFFPPKIAAILECLPFASMQNAPFRIYSGSMTEQEIAYALALQLFWLLALIVTGKLLFVFAEKKVVVQGG